MSLVMEGHELQLFKTNFEASIDAQYQKQIKNLIGQLRQAILERDTNVMTIARRDLMVEQAAMYRRLQRDTHTIR